MTTMTPDKDRGIQYAESLDHGTVCYPDPEKIRRYHREWEDYLFEVWCEQAEQEREMEGLDD